MYIPLLITHNKILMIYTLEPNFGKLEKVLYQILTKM